MRRAKPLKWALCNVLLFSPKTSFGRIRYRGWSERANTHFFSNSPHHFFSELTKPMFLVFDIMMQLHKAARLSPIFIFPSQLDFYRVSTYYFIILLVSISNTSLLIFCTVKLDKAKVSTITVLKIAVFSFFRHLMDFDGLHFIISSILFIFLF